MDVRRNHLVADIDSVPASERSRYTPVPAAFIEEARQELGDEPAVYVDPNKKIALMQWAAKKQKKQRARTKLAKASRQRNRTT